MQLVGERSLAHWWGRDTERASDDGHVRDVAVAIVRSQWCGTKSAMGGEETVHLGDVHPSEQVGISGRIVVSIAGRAGDALVDGPYATDRLVGRRGGAEGGGGEEVRGALQSTPRIRSVVRVVRDACHRSWMKGLKQQSPQATDEHRRVRVNRSDRPILVEPPRTRRADHLGRFRLGVGAGDSVMNGGTEAEAEVIDQRHAPIVSADRRPRRTERVRSGVVEGRMPRWVPRAIAVFWAGFLGALVVREVFHQLSGLLVLLLIALFLALAIEPGVNVLERRGWSRGLGTLTIFVAVIVALVTMMVLVGSLVGSQVADVLRNSDRYVSDSVAFLNDNFGTNIDPAEVNDSINDPNGRVQRFIRNQQSRVFSLSINVLDGALQTITVVFFTFYLVADAPRLRRAICSRLAPERQRIVMDTWQMAIDKTGGFLYSRTLLAVLSTIVHWIAFQLIGSPAPLATAIWVGVVSQFVPVLGTYVAAVLPLLLTFFESPNDVLFVAIVIVVYQQIENYIVAPRITARTLHMHPAVAFGSAIAGAALLGVTGAVLALPAAAMFQSIANEWVRRHEVVVDTTHRRRSSSRRTKKASASSKSTRGNQPRG